MTTADQPIRSSVEIDRVLRVSTRHMPDISQDLTPWHWGETGCGETWVFAYEEDAFPPEQAIPSWLLDICIAARDVFGCNWILLDPFACPLDEFPVYDPPLISTK